MNIDNLVRMANQIGTFFESFTDRDEALEGIAGHLMKFWDPRMRRQLVEYIENSATPELADIVRESIETHKPRLV